MITASGIAPVEFAREIFRTLGLYSREALDAWYALFRFGDVSRYCRSYGMCQPLIRPALNRTYPGCRVACPQ